MEIKWMVEIDPFCRKVLTKHWPDVPKYEDVRDVGEELEGVDLICGGFPCPVVSSASRGKRTGEWLWPEFARVVRDLRPRYVIVENVSGLRFAQRGFGEVLGDLAEIGYDAEWREFPASAFGAPHKRARLWVVAHPHRNREPDRALDDETPILPEPSGTCGKWPDPPLGIPVDDGIPAGLANGAFGNAVVPQVAQWIGERIIDASM